MKITLLTYGSRGDVQPFAALAHGLAARGHEVRLAAPHRFAGFAAEQGIPFVPLAGDPEEISRRINEAGANPLRMVRGMREYVLSIAAEVARAAFAACEGADLLVHSFLFTTGGHSIARQMGIPDVSAQLFPVFLPTSEFPNVAMPEVPPGPLSALTHHLANAIFWYGGNSGYARLRKGAPELFPKKLYWPFQDSPPRLPTPYLGAWSPSVLPKPHDWRRGEVHITGYWFLDEAGEYQPPADLADFLASGEKPLCITFGSMVHREADRIAREVMAALSRTGDRAVILTGWGAWNVEPRGEVLFLQDAPHEWLFPRCKAVIHHGGAGTTAAGLRSGAPNLVVPFAADQLFWAKRAQALGAAPAPIPVASLTAERLVTALGEAQEETLLLRASLLAARIRGEEGVGQAVRVIEECGGMR